MRNSIIIVLFFLTVSCSEKNSLESSTWVGYIRNTETYFEMWFSNSELIIYDFQLGLYRATYTMEKSELILTESSFPIKYFMFDQPNCNELNLIAHDTVKYQLTRACVPYIVDPFTLEITPEGFSDEIYDQFWTEVYSRRNFFLDYLRNDTIKIFHTYN